MLTSFALIFLLGMLIGGLINKLKLPRLLGMLLTGILLGPYVLNLLDSSVLGISADLRKLALIIILIRAGLSLDINDLKKVGRPAVLMCFVPACIEMLGVVLIAPKLLGISSIEAAIMGAVVCAVSPSVIIPRMLSLIENKYGAKKGIPQIIMSSVSAEACFSSVMLMAFIGLEQGGGISPLDFIQIPASIALGLLGGVSVGVALTKFFEKISMRDTLKVIVLLSISFLFFAVEGISIVPFSGVLATVGMSAAVYKKNASVAQRLSSKFSKIWLGAEIMLFVLVGASVDLGYAVSAGFVVILVVLGALMFRMAGVFCCLIKTHLSMKERAFCMIAYIPKATVQAAIGSIPLSMGLSCGKIVLTVAVLVILTTAPLGAFGIDLTYKRLLME